jgi:hypothetical protein
MLCLARNSFVVTPLWAWTLSWYRVQLPEHHFSGRCLCIASQRHCNTVLKNSIFTVCPLGTFSWGTSPSVSKNAINMVFTLDFPCCMFFGQLRWCHVPLGRHLLCFWVIPVNPAFITSDYWGHEVWIILDSIMEVSVNWHVSVLLLCRQETAHKFRCHMSHLQIFS